MFAVLAYTKSQQTFYVGVTFDGDTAAEAKQLIDKVKSYTNLFVVQSGSLQQGYNVGELEALCDYAVNAGLNIIVYFGSYQTQINTTAAFINTAQARWGSHFLDVYYGDEPGGKMLDSDFVYLGNITKGRNQVAILDYRNDTFVATTSFERSGVILVSTTSQVDVGHDVTTQTLYFLNGTITYQVTSTIQNAAGFSFNETTLTYQPDGTVQDENGTAVTNQGDITKFEPYQQLWDSRPLQTYDEAATAYVNTQQATISQIRNQTAVNVFTSDYALYWWDYLSGYDVLLAQLGWNHTTAQDISLVRGAANLQNKTWGVILTWKYTEPPYLASSEEIYSQMRTAYECGAKYVVLFNYGENRTSPYGILQEEHFQALQRFWNDVVQNPLVFHGGIHADTALVLPSNYGWGMRNPDDTIWGWWSADEKAPQIWTQLQNSLKAHGSRLDIVYADPTYPVTGRYSQIYYWNQTG